MQKYLLFWDFASLIYTTKIRNKRRKDEFKDISSQFLRKIDIFPDIEKDIKIIFFAIRSIWNKYCVGLESKWDHLWKERFDTEMNSRIL
jgi:hypothetical protein